MLALTAEQIEDIRKRLKVTIVDGDDEPSDSGSFSLPPIESFVDMNLDRALQQAIADRDFTAPTPIQAAAVPVALSGRDLLACAQTGSGKTASFAIPLVQHCAKWKRVRRRRRRMSDHCSKDRE